MSDVVHLQVLLGGVDVSAYVDLNQAQVAIDSALNDELDTITLTLTAADAMTVQGWQDIQILDSLDITHPLFGGYVLMPNQTVAIDKTKNDMVISASDYAAYLSKVYFTGEFTNYSDAQILAAVVAGCPDLSTFDATTFVTSVRTYTGRVVFAGKSVREIITWLADQAGASWYVDYNKRLHFFGSSEMRAPFDIVADPTDSANCLAENVKVNRDATGVVNVVELIGGKALSADATFKYTKIGYGVSVPLDRRFKPWAAASKIVVRRNDGGPTINLVVNPSFEVNITDGWTQYQAGTGAAWAQDASKYFRGVKCLKITAGTAIAVVQGQNITLNPGETLTVQSMAWCAAVGKAAVVIWDVGNSRNRGECYNRKTSSWELLTAGYYNDTAAALTLRCELYNNGCDSATICYFDGVQAEKLQWPSAYCDGSLGTGYAWTGTANNSTSTRVNVPVWTTLTVKTGNTDTLGARNEVLYYESEAKLEQETFWPTLADAIEIDGRDEVPVHVICKHAASYLHYGKWMKTIINDTSIVDAVVARIRCATELAQYALETTVIEFDVRRPGLRAGQTINVNLPARHVDGDYLIKRVSTKIGVGGHLTAHVELGAVNSGLVGLLLALKRESAGVSEYNPDEVINKVLDFSDTFQFTDEGVVVTRTRAPYLYGTAKYGYAKYG
ncbi:MAG: hypothetical protein AB9897_01285 [Anaerolineaceae bacterium]